MHIQLSVSFTKNPSGAAAISCDTFSIEAQATSLYPEMSFMSSFKDLTSHRVSRQYSRFAYLYISARKLQLSGIINDSYINGIVPAYCANSVVELRRQ